MDLARVTAEDGPSVVEGRKYLVSGGFAASGRHQYYVCVLDQLEGLGNGIAKVKFRVLWPHLKAGHSVQDSCGRASEVEDLLTAARDRKDVLGLDPVIRNVEERLRRYYLDRDSSANVVLAFVASQLGYPVQLVGGHIGEDRIDSRIWVRIEDLNIDLANGDSAWVPKVFLKSTVHITRDVFSWAEGSALLEHQHEELKVAEEIVRELQRD